MTTNWFDCRIELPPLNELVLAFTSNPQWQVLDESNRLMLARRRQTLSGESYYQTHGRTQFGEFTITHWARISLPEADILTEPTPDVSQGVPEGVYVPEDAEVPNDVTSGRIEGKDWLKEVRSRT